MRTELRPLLDLTLAEKLEIVEHLWDSIASEPDSLPMLEWQKEEFALRKAAHLHHPETGSSWETVKERILRIIRILGGGLRCKQ